jgi:RNA polymerase-binding protein DksA
LKRATKTTKAKRKTAGKAAKKATKKSMKKAAKQATRKTAKKAARTTAKKTAKKAAGGTTAKAAPEKAGRPAKLKGLKVGQGRSSSRAEELRSILEAKRSEILQEIRRARQDSVKTDRETYAEVGDLVSASVEKERAFEYGELGVQLLREIDTALEKLKEGTFGICEMCTKPIGIRRLKVMPSARLCIKCKSMEEASGPGARGRSPKQGD